MNILNYCNNLQRNNLWYDQGNKNAFVVQKTVFLRNKAIIQILVSGIFRDGHENAVCFRRHKLLGDDEKNHQKAWLSMVLGK